MWRIVRTHITVVASLLQVLPLCAHEPAPVRTANRHVRADCVAFSPDGTILASGSTDFTITLWDARTVTATTVLDGHSGAVTSLAFSPDGKTLASGSADGTLRLWDLSTGKVTETRHTPMGDCYTVWYRPNGKLLATTTGGGALRIWDGEAGHPAQTLVAREDEDHVCDVALTSDGKTLVSLDWEGTFRLWDPATGQSLSVADVGPRQSCCISVNADGSTVSVGTNSDGAHWLLSLPDGDGTMLADYGDAVEDVACSSFSPDGKLLAVGVSDTVELWNVATRKRLITYGDILAYDVAFSRDGKKLAVAKLVETDGCAIAVWDVQQAVASP